MCHRVAAQSLSAASVTHFVKADVGFGWGVALFVVALVPADVVLVRARTCPPHSALRGSRRAALARRACAVHVCQPLTAGGTAAQTMANEDSRALLNLYAIPYWATQILTWLVLPLHQLYADAGDFTVRARLRTSVRENGLFYVVLGILGLVVMIVLVITKGISVGGIVSGAVAFSLSFSIATGVFLMGYGFSEIPRVCWLRSSLSGRKRWCARGTLRACACRAQHARPRRCEHRVGQLSDKLEAEYTELSKLVWSAEQMSNTMPRRHHLRWAMDVIDESIKKSAVPGAPPDAENKDEDDYDYEDIHVRFPIQARHCICSLLICAFRHPRRWLRCGGASTAQSVLLIASSTSTCTRCARPSKWKTSSFRAPLAEAAVTTCSAPRCAHLALARTPSSRTRRSTGGR